MFSSNKIFQNKTEHETKRVKDDVDDIFPMLSVDFYMILSDGVKCQVELSRSQKHKNRKRIKISLVSEKNLFQ